jgi:hypothetical protein
MSISIRIAAIMLFSTSTTIPQNIEETASKTTFHREKMIIQIMLDSCARIYN